MVNARHVACGVCYRLRCLSFKVVVVFVFVVLVGVVLVFVVQCVLLLRNAHRHVTVCDFRVCHVFLLFSLFGCDSSQSHLSVSLGWLVCDCSLSFLLVFWRPFIHHLSRLFLCFFQFVVFESSTGVGCDHSLTLRPAQSFFSVDECLVYRS